MKMNVYDVLNCSNIKLMFDDGAMSYPNECCGMVFSDGTVHSAENIQQKLHEESPGIYSRSAATGYAFSISDTQLLSNSFDSSNPVLVIYHSHPDVGAYFSVEDKNKAVFYGELIFPVAYLVLDIRKGKPFGAKLFNFFDGDFYCELEFNEEGEVVGQSKYQ